MVKVVLLLLFHHCTSVDKPTSEENIDTPALEDKDTVIVLTMQAKRPANFYYTNEMKGTPVNLSKDLVYTIESQIPVYLMQANELQTPYILYPGDSIFINDDSDHTVLLTSKDSMRNSELRLLEQMTVRYGSLRPIFGITYLKKNIDLSTRDSMINKAYHDRMAFLSEQVAKNNFSTEYVTLVKQILHYSRINEKFVPFYPKFDKAAIHAFYKDSMEVFMKDFSCDSCLGNTLYQTALLHFARSFVNEKNTTTPVLHFNKMGETDLFQLYNEVAERFTGRTQDFVKARAAYQILDKKKGQKTNNDDWVKDIVKNINDEAYKQFLLDEFDNPEAKKVKHMGTGEDILIMQDQSTTTIAEMLKSFSGKIVLLDFWATWCAPCIEEMPYSKKLGEQLGDKFAVVFISLDEKQKSWENFSTDNLAGYPSFWLKNSFHSPFVKHHQISTIPRYILIGKEGQILNADAPRPSDAKLEELIKHY